MTSRRALGEGVPYKAPIASVPHKHVGGRLTEREPASNEPASSAPATQGATSRRQRVDVPPNAPREAVGPRRSARGGARLRLGNLEALTLPVRDIVAQALSEGRLGLAARHAVAHHFRDLGEAHHPIRFGIVLTPLPDAAVRK